MRPVEHLGEPAPALVISQRHRPSRARRVLLGLALYLVVVAVASVAIGYGAHWLAEVIAGWGR